MAEEVIPILRVSSAATAAAWYQRLGFAQEIARECGAAVEQMPWGPEVRLRDPDGNRLRIGAPVS